MTKTALATAGPGTSSAAAVRSRAGLRASGGFSERWDCQRAGGAVLQRRGLGGLREEEIGRLDVDAHLADLLLDRRVFGDQAWVRLKRFVLANPTMKS